MSETGDPFVAAREQACEKLGYLRSKVIQTKNHTWEIPNQSLLSYEQQKRYNAMVLYVQTTDDFERYKDVKDDHGNVIKGALKVPWRTKDGKLAEFDYDALLTKAIFGDDKFDEFIADGGNPSDIGLIWAEMNEHTRQRQENDSKSVGGDRRLAAVPDSN